MEAAPNLQDDGPRVYIYKNTADKCKLPLSLFNSLTNYKKEAFHISAEYKMLLFIICIYTIKFLCCRFRLYVFRLLYHHQQKGT